MESRCCSLFCGAVAVYADLLNGFHVDAILVLLRRIKSPRPNSRHHRELPGASVLNHYCGFSTQRNLKPDPSSGNCTGIDGNYRSSDAESNLRRSKGCAVIKCLACSSEDESNAAPAS